MDALTPAHCGHFRVETLNSVWEIVVRPGWPGRLRRIPLSSDASELRNDGHWIDLVLLVLCKVGERGIFHVQHPQSPHNPRSIRYTSTILSITDIS